MTAEINFSVLKTFLLSSFRLLLIAGLLSACSSYKQNIMFKVPAGYNLAQATTQAEQNYTIQKNDFLELNVFTNNLMLFESIDCVY